MRRGTLGLERKKHGRPPQFRAQFTLLHVQARMETYTHTPTYTYTYADTQKCTCVHANTSNGNVHNKLLQYLHNGTSVKHFTLRHVHLLNSIFLFTASYPENQLFEMLNNPEGIMGMKDNITEARERTTKN